MPGFSKIAFTETVRALQQARGSRNAYARLEARESGDVTFGEDEAAFIESRDSFYLATVTSDGWPYVQHRGGPRGFLRVRDGTHLLCADYAGNKQYISNGNLLTNDRAALFLMDYPNRQRLKILAHVRVLETADEPDAAAFAARSDGYRASVERILLFDVVGWDWNCPQHITPRYTLEELESLGTQRKPC